ncbi:MAG: hypothetical protein WEF50_19980 [Myxococcota bacterium]
MSKRSLIRFVAVAAVALAADARADEPAARVIALQGSASAGAGNLAVGDSIASGSVVRTGADSRVGILASQIYVQLDPQSALALERDASGAMRMELESGRARVVDTRTNPTPTDLAVVDATATIAGGDSEFYILKEKAGRFAMFCEWSGPLAVARDPKSLTIGPNQCALAKPHEPLYSANGHDHQIPLLPLPDNAAFNDPVSDHFGTTDVAAGPPGLGFGEPLFSPDFQRDPCDVPGSGCAFGPGGPIVVEPPPDTGGCAPGVACGE